MVLGIPLGPFDISLTRLSLSLAPVFHLVFSYVIWCHVAVPQPRILLPGLVCVHFARHYFEHLVFDFFSSGYLDVSVHPVVIPCGIPANYGGRVAPFGDPRIKAI